MGIDIILDFGCGRSGEKIKDSIGIDIDPSIKPDVAHDLNQFPYPFNDNYADAVYAKHIIEHLDYPQRFIEEITRILKPGGSCFIETPHFSNYVAYSEPQHKRYFSYFMFRQLSKNIDKTIRIVEWKITFYKTFRFCGIKALANNFPEQYERFWVYLFPAENVIFKFEKL